ncbi:MAG: pilus assembly protein TadG-related protein [Pseudomonadota bacterium]
MAVFVALFFQVLFVFFAMAINVGLVIHDKINLQNAVDIAAYYGAAKQAETLNQIAHINFQMRQNYKLFVWRYRVLGTVGRTGHPYANQSPFAFNPGLDSQDAGNAQTGPLAPNVCVASDFWKEYKDLDPAGANLCRFGQATIPNIPPQVGGAGFIPGISQLGNLLLRANQQMVQNCLESGVLNWMNAARWLIHFRVDGAARKSMIRTLATGMSSPNFNDLRNESVEQGVRNTLEFNLTNSNRAGLTNFQYFNSMAAQGQCSDPSFWLPEILINPVITFTDMNILPNQNNSCAIEQGIPNRQIGGRPNIGGFTNLPRGLGVASVAPLYANAFNELSQHWGGEPNAQGSNLHSSIGFEKNPWCMVYSGVSATTQVRKPFSPLGAITLQARGFAKPFGGRVGPWYGIRWPQGSPTSQASSRDEMVDRHLPSREVAGGGFSGDPFDDIANHSRFPGDPLGMRSMAAIASMTGQFRNAITPPIGGAPTLSWRTYNHLGGEPILRNLKDSLARNSATGFPARQRAFEWAATAPDLFDAIYYSIEPKYFRNYFGGNTTNNGARFPANLRVLDFGSGVTGGQANPPPGIGSADQPQVDVENTIQNAVQIYEPNYPWPIRDWRNLLTSWHQAGAVDFEMDDERFGRCETPVPNPNFPTTGNCLKGGRTGYSVKNISRDYLLSGDHELSGSSSGPILNPPNF